MTEERIAALAKAEKNAQWGEIGKDILTSKFAAPYKIEGPWASDDESLLYHFDVTDADGESLASEVTLTVPTVEETETVTYYNYTVSDGVATWASASTPSAETAVIEATAADVNTVLDGVSTGNIIKVTEVELTESTESSTASHFSSYATGSVEVTVVPNETLAEKYPHAIVVVDGKEFDLAYVGEDKPLKFGDGRDHRITIRWSLAAGIVETYRLLVVK